MESIIIEMLLKYYLSKYKYFFQMRKLKYAIMHCAYLNYLFDYEYETY